MNRLEGRTAVVTNVSDKLGYLTAVKFAEEGAAVVVTDADETAAKAVAEELTAKGAKAAYVQADTMQFADCEKIAKAAVDAFGSMDVLFANEEYKGDMIHDVAHVDPANVTECFEKNVIPTFNSFRAAAPVMVKQRGGCMIARGSMFGERSGNTGYGPAKAAVSALASGVAMEIGRYNIRVNTVAPSFLEEELEGISDEYRQELIDASPMYTLPVYDDVVNAILYLAADEGDCISAVTMVVDKGAMLGQSVNKTPLRG